METRMITCEHPVELVRSATGQESFRGYASVFYDKDDPASEYRMGFGQHQIRERIMPGAWDRVLNSTQEIQALYNHSEHHVLGSTKTGTLFLDKDQKGLKFQIPFDATDPDHIKVKRKMEKGIVKGCSFRAAFETRCKREGGCLVKEVTGLDNCLEISICNDPAYQATACQLRAKEDYAAFEEREKMIAKSQSYR